MIIINERTQNHQEKWSIAFDLHESIIINCAPRFYLVRDKHNAQKAHHVAIVEQENGELVVFYNQAVHYEENNPRGDGRDGWIDFYDWQLVEPGAWHGYRKYIEHAVAVHCDNEPTVQITINEEQARDLMAGARRQASYNADKLRLATDADAEYRYRDRVRRYSHLAGVLDELITENF